MWLKQHDNGDTLALPLWQCQCQAMAMARLVPGQASVSASGLVKQLKPEVDISHFRFQTPFYLSFISSSRFKSYG
jgi:hypothetical protein